MNATVNAVCYKSKTLKNGENPIMLRICKQGKMKYLSLGISIDPKLWDFKKNQPKPSCPDRELIQKIILDKKAEYQTQILELKTSNRNFTASSLVEHANRITKVQTVDEFYTELITHYRSIGKVGNSNIYRDSYNLIKTFRKTDKLDFLFSGIDINWLNEYEKWMIGHGRAETTMSLQFRTLRSAFNKAIERNIVRREDYPFGSFKMSKFNTKTKKRSITKTEIKQIINLNLDNEKPLMQLSKNLFIFSYLQSGINLTDIANLRYENIVNGRLQYLRQKTKRLINIAIQEEAQRILNVYHTGSFDPDNYIFPILNKDIHKTPMQKYNRIHKIMGKININLKEIAKRADVKANLTTYVARHTYATVLKRSGVNTSIISESLGHSSEKVTQIYLDSFENSQIDEAMKNLL